MGKTLIFLIVLSINHNFTAQSWQEVFINFNAKSMAFNPYDSTLWLVKKYPAHIDKNGVLTEYNNISTPIFNFVDFTFATPVFTSDAVYSYTNGTNFFYKFDGTYFQKIYLPANQTMSFNMVAFNDTLYLNVGNPAQTLMYYHDQLIGQSNYESFRLKKGTSNFYRSYYNTVSYIDFNQNYMNYFYSTPNNQEIEDLIVKEETDSLFFTSVDKILIADSTLIVDSITTGNSYQMPTLNPIRLRFDHGGNLWTLFASQSNVSKLSMYDFGTQTWQQTFSISDILASHPEMDTNTIISQIEIDEYNNVWLLLCQILQNVTTTKYFVLQQGDVPSWVGIPTISNPSIIQIFPNPIKNDLKITYFHSEPIIIKLYNLSGHELFNLEIKQGFNEFDISYLESGSYILKWQTLQNEGKQIVIKE
ncbi:MAG: T9SS type A sorting domain-containing protein [Bacteroidetes bacterium]|nr:T9SS type A sorting domain-containing protein [Bacteroidota bacterium]